MTHAHFSKLLSPLDLGFVQLRNRTLMGSMHTGLEESPDGFKRMAIFYAARARGGAGLIVTGGISPNEQGRLNKGAAKLTEDSEANHHKFVTQAVHDAGGKIALQILHAGRYSYLPGLVAPSAIQAPINVFKPKEMTQEEIQTTINDFANCARLAKKAGYDGVEIMASEGYLLNQFIAQRTNQRTDSWGGSYENRIKFPLEILKKIRSEVGTNFIIIFRLSMLDLVDNGSTWDEIIQLAKEVEKAGANLINTGIGWHEARVPTIATCVPRAAFTWVTAKLKAHVSVPLITTNRINTPETAEEVLQRGDADMVSMARPFLADPEFVNKAARNKSATINTCIACNQACLDHVFENKPASCLVNPAACREAEFAIFPAEKTRRLAVVGAGPAGMACAVTAASRGHEVSLFEAADVIGGQFNIARRVPGKEEFSETIRYYSEQLKETGVKVFLQRRVSAAELMSLKFDDVVVATGVTPRVPQIPGIDHKKVCTYLDVITGKVKVGKSVAIIGAGGIGFDLATFLVHKKGSTEEDFLKNWGVDRQMTSAGSLLKSPPQAPDQNVPKIFLLQRKASKPGETLGKTTGWIHKALLKMNGVKMLSGVNYLHVDDAGLHIESQGQVSCLPVDNVVICAGQESENSLHSALLEKGVRSTLIGGAQLAAELDAKRAIEEGTRFALSF